ncbi:MAG TPA: hypothetical protein VJ824_03250 [Bacillota bacterium]|nr:hypothetical protein [Bacillota bacterium]
MSNPSLVVKWLPNGHVPHGYRRVFTITDNQKLQYVIVLSFMGYEDVFNMKGKVPTHEIKDPSLLWGLSYIKTLIGTPILTESEDGYISTRPPILEAAALLPIEEFLEAEKIGEFHFE